MFCIINNYKNRVICDREELLLSVLVSLPDNKKMAFFVAHSHSGLLSPHTTQTENTFHFATGEKESFELYIFRGDGLKEYIFYRIKKGQKIDQTSLIEKCSFYQLM